MSFITSALADLEHIVLVLVKFGTFLYIDD